MSVEETRKLAKKVVQRCLPEGERLSNATKSLIDRLMRGDIFENASALAIARWLICADGLRDVLESIPPFNFNGELAFAGQVVTPEQEYVYNRLIQLDSQYITTANAGIGTILLNKLRTLQYGPELSANPQTLSETLQNQGRDLQKFKSHTDNQTGTGDPTAFMRNLAVATGFDSAKQQMEGKQVDNFSSIFNSAIQGPAILNRLTDFLCKPDALTNVLQDLLDLIRSGIPFDLDDILALLGGLTLDQFFDQLDEIFRRIGTLVDYLNALVSLDFARFNFAQAYLSKFTLGMFLASIATGEGRGNCFQRAIMEEFLGSDNLRDAIAKIDLEKKSEDRKKQEAAKAPTKNSKEKAVAQGQVNHDKEVFFSEVPEDQVLQGVVTGSTGPNYTFDGSGNFIVDPYPEYLVREDELYPIIYSLESRLDLLESRTYQLGYRIATTVEPSPTPTPPVPSPSPSYTEPPCNACGYIDGGFYNEFEDDDDGVAPIDVTPTPTPSNVS